MKAFEFLDNEKKLCRGMYASEDGKPFFTNPRPNNGKCLATKWDIYGALMYCYLDEEILQTNFKKVIKWIDNLNKQDGSNKDKFDSWSRFNDTAPFHLIEECLKECDV